MNLKVDQKKIRAIAPFVISILALISFLVWQLKLNSYLKEEFTAKSKEVKHAQGASRHLRELERQIKDMKQKEEILYKRVPLNEKKPLDLIKALISLAGQTGLKEISVSLKEKPVTTVPQVVTYRVPRRRIAATGARSASSDELAAQQEAAAHPEAASATGEEAATAPAQTGPSPVYLEMEFEGGFPQLLTFLKKLMNLKRIVKVEGIRIERKKEILPYQNVYLDLTAYTYLK